MALTTQTVTGTLYYPDGTPINGAKVFFKLSNAADSVGDPGSIPPSEIEVVCSALGAFSTNLWPNDLGIIPTTYTVTSEYVDHAAAKVVRNKLGTIQVPSGGASHTLSSLLSTGYIAPDKVYVGVFPEAVYDDLVAGTFATLESTSTITSADDITINDVDFGRGGGDVPSNTATGRSALAANTTGSGNTAYGRDALRDNATGTDNTASGAYALRDNTTGIGNTASGRNALLANTTGSNNTASGAYVLTANTTGAGNTAAGVNALKFNTTGSNNTASGRDALTANTTGTDNTASGAYALADNTTGSNNTASGRDALEDNTTGSNNTASGRDALTANTTGSNNTASGYSALTANTTGVNNTATGRSALAANTTGVSNTASGRDALRDNTTGSGNFGVGFLNGAGTYAPVFNPTTENNRIVMGHTAVTNAYVQVAWTVVSDERDKTEIEPLALGVDFVKRLEPVSFKFRAERESDETNGGTRYGFIAQQVLAAEGDGNVIVDSEDPDKLKMTSDALVPVLVNAIKDLEARIATLETQN